MSLDPRRHPVTAGFVATLLLAAAASWSARLLSGRPLATGASIDAVAERHELYTLVTAGIATPSVPALLTALALGAVVVGGAERLLAPWRTLLALVTTTVLGVAAGLALQGAGLLVRGVWSEAPLNTVVEDPSIPIAGVAMTASAFAGPLWRRRIRLLGLAVLVVALLYSGQPGDACRLAAGGAGLLLGTLLTRDRPRERWRRSSHHETRSLLAALVGVTALGPVLAIVSPAGYGPLRPLGLLFRDSPSGQGGAAEAVGLHTHAVSVVPLLVLGTLLVAAWGMWFGRRTSAWVAIALNGLISVLTAVWFGLLPALAQPDRFFSPSLATGPTFQQILAALVPAGVAALVALKMPDFVVRSAPRTLRIAGTAIGGVLVAGSGAYVVAGVLGRVGDRRPTLAQVLSGLPCGYLPTGFLHHRAATVGGLAHLLHGWMGPVFWTAVLIAAVVARFDVRPEGAGDGRRLRGLLKVGGAGSMSYMGTWRRNSVWFSADGAHAVSYRDLGGVRLALGEPVGEAQGRPAAARAFALDCDDRGLTPVFYAVSPGLATALADGRGWSVLSIGDDCVIDPAAVTLQGRAWKDIRTSMNRAARLGITASWTTWGACSPARRAEIRSISAQWVATHPLPELGYTLGGVDELRDPEVSLMLALDADGSVLAATSWLPTWRDGAVIGWTLDFMRRTSGTMNGLMEFLIASVLLLAAERAVEFVSLSASPLQGGDPDAHDATRRLLGGVSRLLEPAYGFASLATFKAKFQPESRPLVLACPDALALPATGVALTRAYLPHRTGRAAMRLVTGAR